MGYDTSVMLSRILLMVSRRFDLARSMASSLTSTASILETMLPIECSMRSTRRDSTVNSSYDTPPPMPPILLLARGRLVEGGRTQRKVFN